MAAVRIELYSAAHFSVVLGRARVAHTRARQRRRRSTPFTHTAVPPLRNNRCRVPALAGRIEAHITPYALHTDGDRDHQLHMHVLYYVNAHHTHVVITYYTRPRCRHATHAAHATHTNARTRMCDFQMSFAPRLETVEILYDSSGERRVEAGVRSIISVYSVYMQIYQEGTTVCMWDKHFGHVTRCEHGSNAYSKGGWDTAYGPVLFAEHRLLMRIWKCVLITFA